MSSPPSLPEGWTAPESVEDTIDADGLTLHRAGFASRRDADEAIGSAVDWESSPVERSRYELIERVVVMDAARGGAETFPLRSPDGAVVGTCPHARVFPVSPEPSSWTYARSNGVSLHTDWKTACVRAEQEIFERDRVLRSWLGETKVRRLDLDLTRSPLAKTRSYTWRAYEFPPPAARPEPRELRVVGIFGFAEGSLPLAFGYGCRSTLAEALAAATRETLQLLGFLWGEPLPEEQPEPKPTPMAHLETYQWPERREIVRHWLDDGHVAYGSAATLQPAAATEFVDLTPPWLAGQLNVARALSRMAMPLTFGVAPWFAHLPPRLRVHPIP